MLNSIPRIVFTWLYSMDSESHSRGEEKGSVCRSCREEGWWQELGAPLPRVQGQQRDKTVPLKGSLQVECHSPNKEAGALDLCLGSPLSEKHFVGKGGSFARISVTSWREHFVWSQLGFSPDRRLLVIPPRACLQEASHIMRSHAQICPWWSPVGSC